MNSKKMHAAIAALSLLGAGALASAETVQGTTRDNVLRYADNGHCSYAKVSLVVNRTHDKVGAEFTNADPNPYIGPGGDGPVGSCDDIIFSLPGLQLAGNKIMLNDKEVASFEGFGMYVNPNGRTVDLKNYTLLDGYRLVATPVRKQESDVDGFNQDIVTRVEVSLTK